MQCCTSLQIDAKQQLCPPEMDLDLKEKATHLAKLDVSSKEKINSISYIKLIYKVAVTIICRPHIVI